MSKFPQNLYESVDLTEDEDSRDNIHESAIGSRNSEIRSNVQNFETLPPLIPIPRIKVNSNITGHNIVPTLTKIQSQSEPPKIVHNIALSNFFGNAALVGSPQNNLSTSVPSLPLGKIVLIKKNDKLYKIVIPHNVMPSCDAGGPVVINIPEVGPLVIKIDPQVRNQPAPKPSASLEPFSLNFDDIIEKASTGEIMEEHLVAKRPCTPTEKVFSTTEKVFHCWTSLTARTRPKYGAFKGFPKRECASNKRCLNQLKSFITKNKRLLEEESAAINFKKPKIQQKKIVSDNIDADFDNLLMTKKVVILKNGEEESLDSSQRKSIKRRQSCSRRGKSVFTDKINLQPIVRISRYDQQLERFGHLIKPCFVKMNRIKDLDDLNKNKKCLTITPKTHTKYSILDMSSTNLSSKINKSTPGTSKTNQVAAAAALANSVDLEGRKILFLSRLIKDVRTFNTEMAFIKPLLIINEFNYSIVRFDTGFCKSNIVFPVGKDGQIPKVILQCKLFRDAVVLGYVKLVDSDILCSYLRGEIGPGAPGGSFT